MPATPPEMSAAAAPPERILNPEFVKLFAAFHFFMLGMSVFNLLPHYLELRGASEGMYGAVAGTLGVVNFFCIVLWGHQADRWSRKTTVVFYLLLGIAGNAVAILAMDAPLNWYFLSRALQGITMGLGFPIIFVWTFEVSPPARKHMWGGTPCGERASGYRPRSTPPCYRSGSRPSPRRFRRSEQHPG